MSEACNSQVRLKNVTKNYNDKCVLKDVSFSVAKPGLYTIVGASGSGKTTLLSLICGFEKPSSGEVVVNGSIGYVFQESNLIPDFSASDNIRIVGVDEQKALQLLKNFGLSDCASKKASLLSGGEKQRVAVARCLAMKADILVLDEPTGNLDKDNADYLFKLLKEISKDIMVLVVTHDRDLADLYADHTIRIDSGRVVCDLKDEPKTVIDNKQNNAILSKYGFKYAMNLIKDRKPFFIFSIVLLALTLVLEFFCFDFFLFNEGKATARTVEKSDFPLLSLSKSYYNENDMTEYTYTNGKTLENEIKSYTKSEVIYKNKRTIKSTKHAVNTKYNVTLVPDDYEFTLSSGRLPNNTNEIVITDFLAQFIFEDENPLGKAIDLQLFSDDLFSIVGIQKTTYEQSDYDNYYSYPSFQESHTEFIEKYLAAFLYKASANQFLIEKGNLLIQGGNFAFSDKGSQAFCIQSSRYVKGSMVSGLEPLKNNEVVISTEYQRMYFATEESLIGSEVRYLDLNHSINKNKLLDNINLFDIYPTVKIVGIADMTYDVAVSDSFFETIVREYLPFKVQSIAIKKPSEETVRLLYKNGFTITDSPFSEIKGFGTAVKGIAKPLIALVSAVLIVVVLTSVLVFSSLINRKMHEIATLKCLGATNKKLLGVFSIYSFLSFAISYAISFVLEFVGRLVLNAFVSNNYFPTVGFDVELISFNPLTPLIAFGTCFVLSLCIIALPLVRIGKIEPAILLKKTL